MTTRFGYKKCKNAFEGLGLKLPKISKKTKKRVGSLDLEYIVYSHDISLIFINDYNFASENCREELMKMANGVIAENHIIRTDYGLNNFLEENEIISPFRISFISTKGLSCCKAIKEMNEIETKQKAKSKTEAVYYGAEEDEEGVVNDIFYITLSNFWLKSTVHFTFALSLLRQDFWNKEKEVREAMKFAFGKGKDIFKNKKLNWPRCTKKTYDDHFYDIFYDSFNYLGCLTFSKVYKKVIEKGYFEEYYFDVGNKHSVSKHLLKTSFYKRLAEKFAVKQVKKVKKAKKVA